MAKTIEIDVSRMDLTELLALVEAGHDVILLRDAVPFAKATRILGKAEVQGAIEAISGLAEDVLRRRLTKSWPGKMKVDFD